MRSSPIELFTCDSHPELNTNPVVKKHVQLIKFNH